MGMGAEVEPLNADHLQPQHHEMLWQRCSFSQLIGEGRRGVQWIRRGGPAPDGSSCVGELLPALLAELRLFGGCDQRHLSPQAVLLASFGEQPAQFSGSIVGEFRHLLAALIAEQFELVCTGPAAEHQGSHPGCAVASCGGQLHPAGGNGASLPLHGRAQQRSPRGDGPSDGLSDGLRDSLSHGRSNKRACSAAARTTMAWRCTRGARAS